MREVESNQSADDFDLVLTNNYQQFFYYFRGKLFGEIVLKYENRTPLFVNSLNKYCQYIFSKIVDVR